LFDFIADKPENVRLTTNTTSKVCTGVVINFTCIAEANPPVHTYLLYESDTVIKNIDISGTWIKSLENPGNFVFRCEANNCIQGIGKSGNTTLTVDGRLVCFVFVFVVVFFNQVQLHFYNKTESLSIQ